MKTHSPMFIIFFTVLLDLIGFGIVLPLLPFYAQHMGANALLIGLLGSSYSIAQFIFSPILGSLSDRLGRKPVIIISLVLGLVANLVAGLTASLIVLFIARFISGVGGSSIGAAQAYISDITTPENRAKGMGMVGAAIGLGFVIGPAIGGILSLVSQQLPFFAAATLALINLALVYFVLPESHQPNPAPKQEAQQGRRWQAILNSRVLLQLVAISFIFNLAFSAMEGIFPLYSQHRFGWGSAENGYIFAYIGVVVVIMQGGLIARLVRHFGEVKLLIGGLALLALGLGGLVVSFNLVALLIALAVLALGEGASTPSSSSLLSLNSPAANRGQILGIAQGASSLSRVLGPMLGGLLFQLSGDTITFVAITLVMLLALPLAVALRTTEVKAGHFVGALFIAKSRPPIYLKSNKGVAFSTPTSYPLLSTFFIPRACAPSS